MSKILIISPTPTHPANAGNRIRIFKMANYLIKNNYEVHFLYSNQEKADIEAMKNYWGGNLTIVEYAPPSTISTSKLANRAKSIFISDYKYYSGIDDYYNTQLDDFINRLLQTKSFDFVMVEYIFLSKAFKNFPTSVLKILDTHDVMTDRHKTFLKAGKKPEWHAVTQKQESKAIERADIVIAIQNNERDHFKHVAKTKAITIGHMVDIHKAFNRGNARKRILFVGSGNPNNYHGLSNFIENIFPIVLQSIPGLEFYIAGNICNVVETRNGIIKLGEVSNIKDAYDYADIIINPLTFGTGLKIKSIEALGYSKVLLSTTVGIEGLESGIGSAFIVADSPTQWASSLMKVIDSPSYYCKLIEQARIFAEDYNDKVGKELLLLMS